MDVTFEYNAWQPTKLIETDEYAPGEAEVASLAEKLSDDTKELQHHPYDPYVWLERGRTLGRLLYPELATGDFYKADLLCESLQEHNRTRGLQWQLGWRMGFWMREGDVSSDDQLQPESTQAGRFHGMRHQSALEDQLNDVQLRITQAEVEQYHDYETRSNAGGKVRKRPYPWMSERHRHRSDELIKLANVEFADTAVRHGCKPACELRRNAIGRIDGDQADTSDVLGVFATRQVVKGELMLIDETEVFGCIGPGARGDNDNLHGDRGCSDPVHPNLPEDDTAHELRWIRDELGLEAASSLALVRLLLKTIKAAVAHPLDDDMAARLTPNYARAGHRRFSRKQDLAVPLRALAQFGRDIFADPACETWVLCELFARLDNNSWSSPAAHGAHPLFSMFNHSCEPNVRWRVQAGTSSPMDHRLLRMHAMRDIAAGEQFFVEYDSYAGDKDLRARREHLEHWLDGPCQCSRCLREEEVEAKATAAAVQGVSAAGSALLESVASAWDVDEKPVLPEDRVS